MEGLLTPWRLRAYPKAVLFALLVPIGLVLLSGSGTDSFVGPLGGDLPAFYGAGVVYNEHGVDAIYDQEVLNRVQRDWR